MLFVPCRLGAVRTLVGPCRFAALQKLFAPHTSFAHELVSLCSSSPDRIVSLGRPAAPETAAPP